MTKLLIGCFIFSCSIIVHHTKIHLFLIHLYHNTSANTHFINNFKKTKQKTYAIFIGTQQFIYMYIQLCRNMYEIKQETKKLHRLFVRITHTTTIIFFFALSLNFINSFILLCRLWSFISFNIQCSANRSLVPIFFFGSQCCCCISLLDE